ncbi:type II secretion system F family protein [Rossellomorea aquimaris]|uniref:type II secretion system F family protein n=1 Tax=Rossellomorea aquimaris TaxID=189382 RepID=UPI0007D08B5A|nr:type II secretion system F family protein [Rossellomorea aquimaris]
MLYLSFFFFISLFVYGLVVFQREKKQKIHKRLSSVFDGEREAAPSLEMTAEASKSPSHLKGFLSAIFKQLKRNFDRKLPNEKVEKLDMKLLRAGSPFGMSPVDFRIIQLGLFLLIPIGTVMYGVLLQLSTAIIVLLALVGMAFARYLPHYYLKKKAQIRSKVALKELPDFLDLLTVSLEAGLGFDGAISKVVSKKHGVLAQEFRRCLEEMRLGKTRRESLSGIRDRLITDEVKAFISSIVQAEKLGVGLVQVLRVQSIEVRDQRKQRAEETAMKAPIKMLFPLVLFIFPSLFIVLLGPAVIQFIQTFSQQ